MTDWITWNGGEQPVPDGTLVDVVMRGFGEITRCFADDLDWTHPNNSKLDPAGDGDIIKYRITKDD